MVLNLKWLNTPLKFTGIGVVSDPVNVTVAISPQCVDSVTVLSSVAWTTTSPIYDEAYKTLSVPPGSRGGPEDIAEPFQSAEESTGNLISI